MPSIDGDAVRSTRYFAQERLIHGGRRKERRRYAGGKEEKVQPVKVYVEAPTSSRGVLHKGFRLKNRVVMALRRGRELWKSLVWKGAFQYLEAGREDNICEWTTAGWQDVIGRVMGRMDRNRRPGFNIWEGPRQ